MSELFTQRKILELPTKQTDYYLQDKKNTHLFIKVCRGTGTKVFYFKYRSPISGKKQTLRIGRFGNITLKNATIAADRWSGIVASGRCPHVEKKESDQKSKTFLDIIDEYEKNIFPTLKKSTVLNFQTVFKKIKFYFGNKLISDISQNDIDDVAKKVQDASKGRKNGTTAHNQFLRKINTILLYCIERKYIKEKPFVDPKYYTEESRERFASRSEIRLLKNVFEDENNLYLKFFYKLLLYTGCRSSEIRELKWEYVNLQERWINIPTTKSKRGHRVYINDGCLNIFRELGKLQLKNNPYCIAGETKEGCFARQTITKSWHRFLDKINQNRDNNKIENLNPHDIRRTIAKELIDAGCDSILVDRIILAHRYGSSSMITIYQPLSDENIMKYFNKIYEIISTI